jgi:hypothetical protein
MTLTCGVSLENLVYLVYLVYLVDFVDFVDPGNTLRNNPESRQRVKSGPYFKINGLDFTRKVGLDHYLFISSRLRVDTADQAGKHILDQQLYRNPSNFLRSS